MAADPELGAQTGDVGVVSKRWLNEVHPSCFFVTQPSSAFRVEDPNDIHDQRPQRSGGERRRNHWVSEETPRTVPIQCV
ncbi:hypothetical protein DPEC_G00115920 [Dallia pectoralis]|uniref:Uncharacterized protein n=1 Tax=Dallia pectoralis TaxID=75939 RepID=A0ACC2GUR3_DALPE|nr:hypothetical protein DPEC_G00115920 [Dallia pectoralis]